MALQVRGKDARLRRGRSVGYEEPLELGTHDPGCFARDGDPRLPTGKALYDKKCATCHGKLGEGNPNLAKTLKVEFRHLGSKEVQAKSDDELKKVITEGTEKKKPVKGLTDDDLANVIAYLRTLAQK